MKEQYCYNCYFHSEERNEQCRFYCENVNAWMGDYNRCEYWVDGEQ